MDIVTAPRYPVVVWEQPPPRLFPHIQKRIDVHAGRNPLGEPNVRLAYGGNARAFYCGIWMLKYPGETKEADVGRAINVDGEEITLPMDRDRWPAEYDQYKDKPDRIDRRIIQVGDMCWHLEEWLPPEVACRGWEGARWSVDPDTGTLVDVLGDEPREGAYQEIAILRDDRGLPRDPGDVDVEWVAQKIREREQDYLLRGWRPEDGVPERAVSQAMSRLHKGWARADEQAREEAKARYRPGVEFAVNKALGLNPGWSFPKERKK